MGRRGDTAKARNKGAHLVIREKSSPLQCLYACTHLHSPDKHSSQGSGVLYVMDALLEQAQEHLRHLWDKNLGLSQCDSGSVRGRQSFVCIQGLGFQPQLAETAQVLEESMS